MTKNLKQLFWNWRGIWIAAPIVTVVVILLRWGGLLESLEWSIFDQYLRLRPSEFVDQRIAIVGLDEADMEYIGQGYVPDKIYARLIQELAKMQPRAIGLDIYRDLPYQPGHEQLIQVFESTENLVGIEKVIGDNNRETVKPPPILKQNGRATANDLMVDKDNTIRRAFLMINTPEGETVYSLGLYLAMLYLSAEGIGPQVVPDTENWWQFGEVVFVPFEANDGGYIRADAGDYQVLLNYRNQPQPFDTVSVRDILEKKVSPDWAKDRIILIGSVGESFQDLFSTPYTLSADQRLSGVEIHAHITSQILSAALDNRPLIKTVSEPIEWLFILFWSGVGATLTWTLRLTGKLKQFLVKQISFSLITLSFLLGSTYLAFIQGWWLPVIPPFLGLIGSTIAIIAYIARSAGDIRKTFGRYLTDEIVASLLEHPDGLKLGGERRKITILTSDLRGFTALSERLQPEEVVRILNFYLSKMADVITAYQGTIDEFMGDGILVLFGAPNLRENDAQRAVACAVAMQLAMEQVNQQLEEWGLSALEMGIGINTGEVVVGNLGSEKRTKYGVVGSQVNLTYRIESYTTGGQIIISEPTLQAAGETIIQVENQKLVQPKGVKRPIKIYEISGIDGEYHLYLEKEAEEYLTLPKSIPLQYTILEGKHVSKTLYQGWIQEMSKHGALIRVEATDQTLPDALTNIKINLISDTAELTEDVYAKVLDQPMIEKQFYIRFTAKPPAVQAKLNEIYHSYQTS
jgi:adenylate cyclase